ncbi:hypothetical protein M9458_057551, partial [Cirrhinus mrigala]
NVKLNEINPDLYHYLVETECVYTREAVKAYRSLDTYNYFISGKVGSICSYNVDDVYLVFGEVGASQTLSKRRDPITSTVVTPVSPSKLFKSLK